MGTIARCGFASLRSRERMASAGRRVFPSALPPSPLPPPAASLRVRAHLGENAGRDGTVGVPVRVRQPECDFHCADCKSDFIGPLIARGTFDN
jgi:hypothetical protein